MRNHYPDWKERFDEYLADMKNINKIKHKPPKLIILLKRIEKEIDEMFIEFKEWMLQKLMADGLPQLEPLMNANEIIAQVMNMNDPEKHEEGRCVAASKLLTLSVEKPDEYELCLFFLPPEFLKSEEVLNWNILTSSDKKAADPSSIYLEHCFTLPNVNMLTAAELKAVKEQLHSDAQPFLQHADEWLKLSYSTETESGTHDFFIKNLLPATRPINDSIAKNELLKYCSSGGVSSGSMEIFLGEMPVQEIWKVYKHFGVIKEDTWAKLMECKEEPRFKKRWPVMAMNIPWHPTVQQQGKEQAQVLPVKKSISID